MWTCHFAERDSCVIITAVISLHSYHITAHSPLLKPSPFQCSVQANVISLFHHLDPKRKYYISIVTQKEE